MQRIYDECVIKVAESGSGLEVDLAEVIKRQDVFFFFKQKPAYEMRISDWSSDVCSSDLGLRYEIPINDLETGGIELQGDGDGFLNPFVTGATTFGDLGLQASLGANIALDGDADTSILHYSLHADYEVLPGLFPLIEMNGFTPIDHANRLTTSEEHTSEASRDGKECAGTCRSRGSPA